MSHSIFSCFLGVFTCALVVWNVRGVKSVDEDRRIQVCDDDMEVVSSQGKFEDGQGEGVKKQMVSQGASVGAERIVAP